MKVFNAQETEKYTEIKEIFNGVENAYIKLKEGKVVMPDRLFMDTPGGGDLLLGPAYIKDSGYFGAKVSSFFPQNTKVSKVHSLYVLFSEVDGENLAILDADVITAYRTAAKSAVAAKYLARKDSKTIGMLGMGRQALLHIRYLKEVFNIEKVYAWTRSPEKHKDFQDYIKNELKLDLIIAQPEVVAENADILVDATYSMSPLVSSDKIKNGTLVIGMYHSPKAIQFSDDLLKASKVYVDVKQNLHTGTLSNAIEKGAIATEEIIELKDIIGEEKYRVTDEGVVYFQSGGASHEDLAGAIAIYNRSID